MSRRSSWRTDIKKLANTRAGLVDIMVRRKYFDGAEDRVAGIIAATDVEDQLRTILSHKMITLNSTEENELFNFNGPLGSHGARIGIAYAFGIFGKNTRGDLEVIRLVRNAFAHSPKAVGFWTPEIKKACDQLTVIERTPGLKDIEEFKNPPRTTRERYLVSTRLLCDALFQIKYSMLIDGTVDVPID